MHEFSNINIQKEIYFDELEVGEFTQEIRNKLEGITDLAVLRFNGCGITSLKNFPTLKSLVRLELIDNSFPEEDLVFL
jgi:hypothetical protein